MWRQSFIVGQTASSREEEQQREHKPPNTLHYSLFYPPSFFFFHVVAVQSFSLQCYFSTSGGVIPFSLPSALSIPSSLDFLLDYFVSAHQCKPAPWKHSLLFISIAPCWIAVRFHGQRASEIKWIETIDSFLAGRVRERLIGQEGKKVWWIRQKNVKHKNVFNVTIATELAAYTPSVKCCQPHQPTVGGITFSTFIVWLCEAAVAAVFRPDGNTLMFFSVGLWKWGGTSLCHIENLNWYCWEKLWDPSCTQICMFTEMT